MTFDVGKRFSLMLLWKPNNLKGKSRNKIIALTLIQLYDKGVFVKK